MSLLWILCHDLQIPIKDDPLDVVAAFANVGTMKEFFGKLDLI